MGLGEEDRHLAAIEDQVMAKEDNADTGLGYLQLGGEGMHMLYFCT